MNFPMGVATILGAGALAALLTWLVRRKVHIEALRRHHEIGGAVFLQMGVVFAVLLAFVFNQVWGEYNDADEAIARECGDLRIAALLANNLPADLALNVKALIAAYVTSVIDEEWPSMTRREDSIATEARLRQLALGVTRLPGANPDEAATRGELIMLLRSAQQHRETRLYEMTSGLPLTLWAMLIAFSLTLLGFLFFFGMEVVVTQMAFTAVFAGSLAMVMVILSMLNYPFEGAMALQPTAFQRTLKHIAHVP
jgi:hypothetical protein